MIRNFQTQLHEPTKVMCTKCVHPASYCIRTSSKLVRLSTLVWLGDISFQKYICSVLEAQNFNNNLIKFNLRWILKSVSDVDVTYLLPWAHHRMWLKNLENLDSDLANQIYIFSLFFYMKFKKKRYSNALID